MNSRLVVSAVALCLGGMVGLSVFAAPGGTTSRLPIVDQISVALRQAVPAVDLHHLHPEGPVQIAWADVVDKNGQVTGVRRQPT